MTVHLSDIFDSIRNHWLKLLILIPLTYVFFDLFLIPVHWDTKAGRLAYPAQFSVLIDEWHDFSDEKLIENLSEYRKKSKPFPLKQLFRHRIIKTNRQYTVNIKSYWYFFSSEKQHKSFQSQMKDEITSAVIYGRMMNEKQKSVKKTKEILENHPENNAVAFEKIKNVIQKSETVSQEPPNFSHTEWKTNHRPAGEIFLRVLIIIVFSLLFWISFFLFLDLQQKGGLTENE